MKKLVKIWFLKKRDFGKLEKEGSIVTPSVKPGYQSKILFLEKLLKQVL